MSTLSVNTLDTHSGSDIAIAANKTITGTVAQFKITGGSAGQALTTDGSGVLSFTASQGGSSILSTKSADYTITAADCAGIPYLIIPVDTTSSSVVITLPAENDFANTVIKLWCKTIPANTATLRTSSNVVLFTGVEVDQIAQVISDGTNSHLIGSGKVNNESYAIMQVFEDHKNSGTSGGTFNSGAWRTRDMNTVQFDEGISGSISAGSNQITLPAGKYIVYYSAPCFGCHGHISAFYNTANSTYLSYGQVAYDQVSTAHDNGWSTGWASFTITANTIFELRHRCANSYGTEGYGRAASLGVDEIYGRVTVWKSGTG